jgi:hypothetical protein
MDVISYVHIVQVAAAASIDAGGIIRSLKFTRYQSFCLVTYTCSYKQTCDVFYQIYVNCDM